MAASTAKKLRIMENDIILALSAPRDYKDSLGPLPEGATYSAAAKNPIQIHWFVTNRKQMEAELRQVLGRVRDGVLCWIFYPKASSGIHTDLNRDKGWDKLLKHDMQWVGLISFDHTWSTFGMRLKTEADKIRAARPRERPVFDYVDPKTKSIVLPPDLASAFQKSKKQKEFFDTLSFTNRKEYIEWIVTARRQETRGRRVRETIEKLGRGWKNPANR